MFSSVHVHLQSSCHNTLEGTHGFCPMMVGHSTLPRTPPAVVGSCHSFGLRAAIPDHQACALGSGFDSLMESFPTA